MARIQQITAGRSSRLLLILALAAGAVAAVLAFVALSQGDDGGGTVAGGGNSDVVVASQDIEVGTVITIEMVKLASVDQVITGAATDTEAVVGQAARVKIYENEQVTTSRVGADIDADGARGVVPPGMRGFSVGVEEVRAVGGLLLPGDSVDVLISGTNENDPTVTTDDVAISALILEDIEVLAVAQEAQESTGVQSENPDSSGVSGNSGTVPDDVDEQPDANTVTLIVTPEQAAILVCAQGGADGENRIWLSLRGIGEAPAEERTIFDVCNVPF